MKKMIKSLAIITIITLSLIVLSCKDKDDDPQPHQSTITAFGKTATVTGDASIATADFNTAKGKLEDALSYIEDNASGLNQTMQDNFAVLMTRSITIVIGNTAPASVNKALTVGVDYLKSNNAETIGNALVALASNNAFAN
jgi:hypothetical protein